MPRAELTVTEACQLIVQALDLNFGRGDTAEEPSPLSLQHVPPHAVAAAARLELGLSEPPPGTSVKGHLRPLCEQLGIPTPGWPLPGESPRVIVTEEAARPDKWASSLLDQSVEVPTSAALVAEEDGGVPVTHRGQRPIFTMTANSGSLQKFDNSCTARIFSLHDFQTILNAKSHGLNSRFSP